MKLQSPAACRAASLYIEYQPMLPHPTWVWVYGGNAFLPEFAFQVNTLLGIGHAWQVRAGFQLCNLFYLILRLSIGGSRRLPNSRALISM